MEVTRYFKITIEQDTNKRNYIEEYDNLQSAARGILAKLDDEERLKEFHQYCIHCGSEDITCQCWNDE